jgi:uncharacterized protein (DUF305 family)
VTATAEAPTEAPAPRAGGWQRLVVIVAAALTLVLVGVIIGMLTGLPGQTPPPPPADSVDVGFAQDMSVHHQQAVTMAAWERDHTGDPALKVLAGDIETTQNNQVGRMQGWLELWGAASLPNGNYMTWMTDPTDHSMQGMHMGAPGAGVAQMPGMATPADLRNLKAATGPALDVLFLQLMLRHHIGGNGMLEYAAAHATTPQARNLATQMHAAQDAEVVTMTQLLTERGGTPLPN